LSIQLKLRGLANLKNFIDPIRASILGNWLKSPLIVGAFPHQGMVHKDGEKASAKAAAELGQMYCLSASSTYGMEEVCSVSEGGPKLLLIDARLPEAVRRDLVERACKIPDFKGIIIDAQYYSNRVTENEWKNDFIIPPHLKCGTLEKYRSSHGTTNELRDSYGLLKDNERISIDEVQKIKDQLRMARRSDMKVVVKGIMTKEDGLQAMSMGADAIYVSNGCHKKAVGVPCTIAVLKSIT